MTRGSRALVVYPHMRGKNAQDPEARLEEARGLALAIGIVVADAFALPIRQPRAATLFGEGQVQNIAVACEQNEADLIIVDGALSAIQQRNLEEKTKRKVIDRTGLILEIFGERAATAEGRLQVELAHLDYQAGRLVRSWTHLERQRGGFGFLGGPGETQIEADRRMIRDRMARIRRELEQVRRTRGLHRDRREKAPWPVIALVGYTNAGKSTLFNRLTGASVMAEDLLFATLDPTMRAIRLPGVEKAILSDTVGFISDLPTQLVAAFRATLEEVTAADVIVHVRDIANPDSDQQKRQVIEVLAGLGLYGSEEEGASRSSRSSRHGTNGIWFHPSGAKNWRSPSRRGQMKRSCVFRRLPAKAAINCSKWQAKCSRSIRGCAASCCQQPMASASRSCERAARSSPKKSLEGQDGSPQIRLSVRLTDRELGRFTAL